MRCLMHATNAETTSAPVDSFLVYSVETIASVFKQQGVDLSRLAHFFSISDILPISMIIILTQLTPLRAVLTMERETIMHDQDSDCSSCACCMWGLLTVKRALASTLGTL